MEFIMPTIQQWIDKKLSEIALKLPTLVHSDPASFACGYNSGYKQAMLDLKELFNFKDDISF